jgi:hypothetical protein
MNFRQNGAKSHCNSKPKQWNLFAPIAMSSQRKKRIREQCSCPSVAYQSSRVLNYSTGLNRKSSRATEAPAFVISGFCPASHCSQLEEQLVHQWKMGAQICMDQTHHPHDFVERANVGPCAVF